MKFWKPVLLVEVAEHERALLFRRDNLVRVLEPGVYRFADPLARLHVDKYDLTHPLFEHPIEEFLVKTHPELLEHLAVTELGDHEVGLVYVDGKLVDVVAPATRKIFWKALHEVRVDVQDIREDFAVPAALVSQLGHARSIIAPCVDA